MTQAEHAKAIRDAAQALTDALRAGAAAGVGAHVTVRIGDTLNRAVAQEVLVDPFARL